VSDPRTRGIPLILETPSNESDEVWRTEVATLHGYVGDRDSGTALPLAEAVRAVREVVAASEKTAAKPKKGAKRKAKDTAEDEADE
jgi:dihydrodipicolinate reductase